MKTYLPVAQTRDFREILTSDKFLTIKNVPVFCEHERTLENGRVLKFSAQELLDVCRRNNKRILDTGDFAAITIGHTSDMTGQQPPVIGYAGPFRFGILDPKTGKKAILADFHIYKEYADELKKYPRRSPELWLEDEYKDMYLDPIALLGAETPYNDLGVLYSAIIGGKKRIKYSAIDSTGMAEPGPGNAYLPVNFTTKKKEKYSMDNNNLKELAELMVSTLKQTPEWKVLNTLVNSMTGLTPTETVTVDKKEIIDGTDGSEQIDERIDKEEEDYKCGGKTQVAYEAPEMYAKDETLDEYKEDEVIEDKEDIKEGGEEVEEHGHDHHIMEYLDKIIKVLDKHEKIIEGMKGSDIDRERYSKLSDLRKTRIFDLEAEYELCRYSKMNDQQFSDHVLVIEQNYRLDPTGMSLPVFPGTGAASLMAKDRPGQGAVEYAKRQREAAENDGVLKGTAMWDKYMRGESAETPDYMQIVTNELKQK